MGGGWEQKGDTRIGVSVKNDFTIVTLRKISKNLLKSAFEFWYANLNNTNYYVNYSHKKRAFL